MTYPSHLISGTTVHILYDPAVNWSNTCLQNAWTASPNALRIIMVSLNKRHNNLINPIDIPYSITLSNRPSFHILHQKVAAFRNTLRIIRKDYESCLTMARIRLFEELRCENYATNKAAFIASALNRTKRSIVLDRAIGINQTG